MKKLFDVEKPVRMIKEQTFIRFFNDAKLEIENDLQRNLLYGKNENGRINDWQENKNYVIEFIEKNISRCHKAVNSMLKNKIVKFELRNKDYPDELCSINDLSYDEYLKTHHWETIKQIVLKRDEGRCVICDSSGNVDCHHRSYNRK